MSETNGQNIVTRNNMPGNMDRKTPISFNLLKYVEKHCNDP